MYFDFYVLDQLWEDSEMTEIGIFWNLVSLYFRHEYNFEDEMQRAVHALNKII